MTLIGGAWWPLRGSVRALPLLGVAPCLAAATVMVSDDDVRLNLGLEEQARAEHAQSTAGDGSSWDAVRDQPGRADDVDWSLRRARISISGTYSQDYRFCVALASDLVDVGGYQSAQHPGIYYAWMARDFSAGEGQQAVEIGLDDAFFNRADSRSTSFLFPNERASAALMTVRGIGLGYHLSTPDADFGVNLMQSLDPAKPSGNANRSDGVFYSARIEYAPLSGQKPSYQESWAGQPGTGILLTGDIGIDDRDQGTPGFTTHRLGWGVEALGHLDQLSVLAELRWLHSGQTANGPLAGVDLDQRVLLVQAGYAFPIGTLLIEPAARWSMLRFGSSAPGTTPTYDGGVGNPGIDSDWGDSGRQYDLGINCYLKGHANKLQLSYSRWSASSGAGRANIWRFQQSLSF